VLKDNPCRSFYDGLDGVLADENKVEVGSIWLPKVAYQWNDIRRASWMRRQETPHPRQEAKES